MADEVVTEEVAGPTAENDRGVAIVADALAVIRAQNENVKIGMGLASDAQRVTLQPLLDELKIGK